MCGIIGYLKDTFSSDLLIKKLEQLEYRGYDSSGISVFCKNEIETYKKGGRISELSNSLKDKAIQSKCGIGHTRWATHGLPTDINSHPHNCSDNSISIVHNGIIENFEQLKLELENKGIKFKSETDSEVIAHLLKISKKTNELDKMRELYILLKGSFAIVAMFKSQLNKVFAITKNMPLILGQGDDCKIVASDLVALIGDCNKKYRMNDGEIAIIDNESIDLYSETAQKKWIEWSKIDNEFEDIGLNENSFFMEKEIYQIPEAINKTFQFLNTNDFVKNSLNKNKINTINCVHFIACGTALHSGNVGKLYCEKLGIKSSSHYASEFRYSLPPLSKNDLCVFISQSGETADTIEALKVAKKIGVKCCAITNNTHSSIVNLADFVLPIKAGPEIAVASTKAYNAQIVAILCLIETIVKTNFYNKHNYLVVNSDNVQIDEHIKNFITPNSLLDDLKDLLEKIEFKELSIKISEIVDCIYKKNHLFFLGRNLDFCTAQEASLKLKEISYIHCEAFPAGELKHGTLALIDDNSIVIAIATQEKFLEKTLNSLYEVKSRGAKTIMISCFEINNKAVDILIKLPTIAEYLSPLLAVIPCQMLALQTAIKKGINPDKPRNLAKSVTVE